jgi:cation diffusion facilitator family transporter
MAVDKIKGGYIEGFVSIIINAALFALKMWAGIVSGSIALIADAWHTLSDSISSVVVVVAAGLSSKKADKEHPFGHGRWEQIASIFIAFILGIIAYDFLKNSIVKFRGQDASVHFGTLAIVVTAISIVVKEALAQYAFYIARKTENSSVKADGWHHRSDALSSVVVLIGILFAGKFWWIDSALGAVIALMLFYAAFEIVKETITKMLGEDISGELVEKIIAEAKSAHSIDMQMHHFHIHNYIVHKELTLHIRLDPEMSIEESHDIVSEIENRVLEKVGIMTTIHVEPLQY